VRIHRLYLQNYRVFEDPLEVEVPAGLVGVYGPNGAGKSTLLEAILFALWGRARTPNQDVRTSGVNAECIAQVTFEQDGHLYEVRRVLSGQAAKAKAQVVADNHAVAEGTNEVARYLHSVLGMDHDSFRASVFAEQKQLDAFSVQQPHQRRELVLGLLGVTPLDTARSKARSEAAEARKACDLAGSALGDLGAKQEQKRAAEAKAEQACQWEREASKNEQETAEARRAAEAEVRRLEAQASVHRDLVREVDHTRRQADEAQSQLRELGEKLAELDRAAEELGSLPVEDADVEAVQEAWVVVSELERARAEAREAAEPVEPTPVDQEALAEAVARAEEATEELARARGRRDTAQDNFERAQSELSASSQLSGKARCPVCGQELGGASEQVVANRRAAAESARQQLERCDAEVSRLEAAFEQAASAKKRAEAEQAAYLRQRAAYEEAKMRAEAARARLAEAEGRARRLGTLVLVDTGEELEVSRASTDQLRREARRRSQRADKRSRLEEKLAGRPELEAQAARQRDRLEKVSRDLAGLEQRLGCLAFAEADLQEAGRRASEAKRAAEEAAREAKQAAVAASAARAELASATVAVEEAEHQRREVERLKEEARHRSRVAELLGSFRESVVAAIGPALSAGAAQLFAELTDNEYEGLELDPETYDIRIWDQGVAHGIRRFSGSETDLANLAVRVAISEHIRFLHGGSVGLLVLDEVFGPLDGARKDRMLAALERLRGRFGQILVVTHDEAVKEQLPSALEVVKLPGRRATVQVA
jgi:exonuclease SbcC